MDANKDYYAILGVHQTAEDFLIKVAYRALAQKYHPDSFSGTKEEAHEKMVLINEAYEVLSNSERRKEYDELRGKGTHDAGSFYDEEESFDDSTDPLIQDWNIAVEYSPDLATIEKRLRRISTRLSYTFRAYLLETKKFSNASKIAQLMEQDFMREYFGKNLEILDFAKYLIETGNKTAARKLNKVVCVFGGGIDSENVIKTIRTSHRLNYKTKAEAKREEVKKKQEEKARTEAEKVRNRNRDRKICLYSFGRDRVNDAALLKIMLRTFRGSYSSDGLAKLVRTFGGHVSWDGLNYSVLFSGANYNFSSLQNFGEWAVNKFIPELPELKKFNHFLCQKCNKDFVHDEAFCRRCQTADYVVLYKSAES